jgi:hypothetical protein
MKKKTKNKNNNKNNNNITTEEKFVKYASVIGLIPFYNRHPIMW